MNNLINTGANRDTGNIHWLYNCEELQQMYLQDIPFYVYFIKHTPTGKFYYGARYKHIEKNLFPKDDFWKEYFTSSKKIKELREEFGDNSFEYKIIFESFDSKEIFNFEQTIIRENINDPLCLNMRYFDIEKSNRIFSVFGKTLSTKGKSKSEVTKQKMRKPKSLLHKQNISKAQQLNGGNGPERHTEESKNKIRETMKLQPRPNKICPYCKKEGGFLSMSRWHFNNCKEKYVKSSI
jgi:hypothetical protein